VPADRLLRKIIQVVGFSLIQVLVKDKYTPDFVARPTVSYILQDHLGSTVGTTDSSGAITSAINYFSFGECRVSTGTLPTDKKYTGQRSDSTGLYYYNARYYYPEIGRFISPDMIVPDATNPQALNRFTYVLNNPLKYTDPTGHGWWSIVTDIASIAFDTVQLVKDPSLANAGWLALDVALTCLPGIPAGAGPLAKGISKGVKFLSKGEKAIEDADKTAEGIKFLAKTSDNFRTNLMRLTGKTKDAVDTLQAHHVLPQEFAKDFKNAGLDVNDPIFGSWVDSSHQKWSKAYNDEWRKLLKDGGRSASEILDKARELSVKYKFEVHFKC
jgi:RHS repeat-associated protein